MRFGRGRHRVSGAAVLILAVGAACGVSGAAMAQVEPHAGMMRFPAISKDKIAFVYANDIWIAPKAGGMAMPLASPPGQETFPRFSADGQTLAFVGNYDGNRDLYTMPVAGGTATRVTHHPGAETLAGWTPDGKLLFLTSGFAGLSRQSQLFTVPASGGLPEQVSVPYAGFGSISPDGSTLAYTLHSTDTRTWKRYRGGMATDVWLFNLKDKTSVQATDFEGTDTLPMWIPGGDRKVVYYLSDAGPEHRLNIWSYTLATRERKQVTNFKDDDIRWPAMGPGDRGEGEIIFQLGSKLTVLNLGSGQSREIKVTIPGDRPKIRQRAIDASRNILGASISPTGKRVAVGGRGDIYSLPAKEGVPRNLTRSMGVAERSPSWSPDGKWIAYFSDESGEYELWVRPSDARPPEEKKDAAKKDEPKKEDAKADDAAKKEDAGKSDASDAGREPRKLTSLGAGFRFDPTWSPDAKWITFHDQNGRLYLTNVESGETKELDKDPTMRGPSVSWSSDSRWLAYDKADEGNTQTAIWIANIKTGEKTRVTSPMFSSTAPAFDRKGDFLFFASNRAINNPVYSDLDTTFAYTSTDTLLMVPLNKDVKNPWAPKSDEETLKKEDKKKDEPKKDDAKKDEKKDDAKPEDKGEGKKEEGKSEQKAADDGVSGTWSGVAKGVPQAPDGIPMTLVIKVSKEGVAEGNVSSLLGTVSVSGTYDRASGRLTLSAVVEGANVTFEATVKDGKLTGTWKANDLGGEWTASRSSGASGDEKKSDGKADAKDEKKDGDAKEVKIDLEGFERRAMTLPVPAGSFGQIAVADGEKLIYVRGGSRGTGQTAGIKIFDYKSTEPKEENLVGGGDFELSADGKKLLVGSGASATIYDASAGGGKAQPVSMAGMRKTISPREEWEQIFSDAWRIMRDYFYEPTMHGVDWAAMRKHYGAMLEDAASREDVNWIIAEMISELNIGHAYLNGPGDVEDQPTVGVGLLGCDFVLEKTDKGTAYKIARIYEGGPWDADARGPLSQPGVDVKEGDYLLAVNGVPLDTSKDPWAAFIGTTDRVTALTVNSSPVMDGKEREVLVKPISSEVGLRYRAWIEAKRAYVEKKSDGKIGYIYVPNTGVDGQSDLFRQFFGQREKAALIIDERWNGGGQIPTRFIELLNRPVTNYWARRDGRDWTWPPDSHQGPKAMLVNGLAGSGGDMFPWLFKHNKIGPVIGTRTWGGLVGISGNPGFVDGGSISVPTFGFYETDGTWGVEGHGVDPDVVVVDDPALMQNGGDPQLDKGIEMMLEAIKTRPYVRPARPQSPNRSGFGLPPSDR